MLKWTHYRLFFASPAPLQVFRHDPFWATPIGQRSRYCAWWLMEQLTRLTPAVPHLPSHRPVLLSLRLFS